MMDYMSARQRLLREHIAYFEGVAYFVEGQLQRLRAKLFEARQQGEDAPDTEEVFP